jgi:hypothetical protein
MEQQLDATYLRPSFVSKAFGLSVAAIGIGTSILLVAYGISLFWRPMPAANTTIDVRIANPELFVTQDKPFIMVPSDTLRIDPQAIAKTTNSDRSKDVGDPTTSREDIIQQEVIVFSSVKHAAGSIITGWKYPNGSGRIPSHQFCYYSSPNVDKSSTRVDIALDGTQLSGTALALVPESEQALKKCQWWHKSYSISTSAP